jgi:WD40 repeat protein
MAQASSASFRDSRSQPPGLQLLRTLRGHNDVIYRLAWSPDLRTIALARCSDLKISFRLAHRNDPISDRAFDTVIAHLQL